MSTSSRCVVILAAIGCCLAAVPAPREYKKFPVHNVTYPIKMAEDPESGYVIVQANQTGQMILLSTRNKANYFQAIDICVENKMKLVKIDSGKKNQLVKTIIKSYTAEGSFWMDGNRIIDNNVWTWSDGNPIRIFSWDDGEPNNANGNEECIELYHREALWGDTSCFVKNYFICESSNNYDMRNLRSNVLSRNGKDNNATTKNYKSEESRQDDQYKYKASIPPNAASHAGSPYTAIHIKIYVAVASASLFNKTRYDIY